MLLPNGVGVKPVGSAGLGVGSGLAGTARVSQSPSAASMKSMKNPMAAVFHRVEGKRVSPCGLGFSVFAASLPRDVGHKGT